MIRRLSTLASLALLCLLAAGCGNKSEVRTLGETEGIYVDVGGMSYQVQLSRILNRNDVEDRSFLRGLAPTVKEPEADEAWFAVFMRVNNPSKQARLATDRFHIEDTQGTEFVPTAIDNSFAYDAKRLIPGEIQPDPNSISGEGDIQGSMLLFKVKNSALQNRPVELRIDAPPPLKDSAVVDLDI